MQYLMENLKDEVDFLPADESFFRLILPFKVCVIRNAQINPNNIF